MALVRRCDRCGHIYDFTSGASSDMFLKEFVLSRRSENDTRMVKVDLCPQCEKELKKWFDSPVRVKAGGA